MKKKLLTAFMFISTLLLTCGILNASAATVDDLTYEVLNGEVKIIGCSKSASGYLTIPSQINGYPVTSIGGGAFFYCSSLTSVKIPDSVTSIGIEAFYKCSGLASVTMGNGVTSIGLSAFYGCSRLSRIEIADSVTSIGGWAFYECSNLMSVDIPDSVTNIGYKAFYNCRKLASITVNVNNRYYSSQDGVLFNKTGTELIQYPAGNTRTNYVIPDSVTSIGLSAFYGCNYLTSVDIADSVTSIGYGTFEDCSSLMSVIIGNGITSISSYAFYNCRNLTSVYITDIEAYLNCSYGNVSSNPMYYAEQLYLNGKRVVNLEIPNTVIQIPAYAFRGCDGLTDIEIPDSVTSIGSCAFLKCSSLTSVKIPDSVTSIGGGAFSWCRNLTSVYITDIAAWCNIDFYGASSNPLRYAKKLYLNGEWVTNLVITDDVTRIDKYAFSYYGSLKSVEMADSVTSIGYEAFYQCSGLTSMNIGRSVKNIENYAFEGCSGLTCVEIPDSVTSIGDEAFSYCSSLTSITVDVNNRYYSSQDGVLFDKNKTEVIQHPEGKTSTSYIIPDSVISIGYKAFYNCDGLISVNIGDGVKEITSNCFYSCSKLKKVTIGKNVSSIGSNAFRSCSALETVVIPKSLTEIEAGVFSGCNSIKTIEYAGSESEWQEIYIGSDNGTLTSATVKYGVVLPIVISYNTNGGTGTFSEQKSEEGGSITISSEMPQKEGYKFLGWSTVSDGNIAEYQPSGTLTVGEDNIVLYAVWRKIVSVDAKVINDIFMITPNGVENGSPIVFVCYKDGVPVYIDVFEYEGSTTMPFVCMEEYTDVKVMIFENFKNLTPLCAAEEIVASQEISLLQLN